MKTFALEHPIMFQSNRVKNIDQLEFLACGTEDPRPANLVNL